MSTTSWRRLLVGLGILGFIQLGIIIWMNVYVHGADPGVGTTATSPFNVTGSATETPFVDRLIVAPGSASFRAGLRTGDRVDLRLLSPGERYRWFQGWRPLGQRIDLPVVRGNTVHRVVLIAKFIPLNWDVWVAFFGIGWMFAFGILIAWRRADSVEGRILASLLILWNIGVGFYPINWTTPWAAADAAVAVLGTTIWYGGLALFATYAMSFAPRPGLLRRAFAWLSYAMVAVAAAYTIAYVFGVWNATADPTHTWYTGIVPQIVTSVLPYLFPLLCVSATIAQTSGAQRARLTWAGVSLGLVYIVSMAMGAAVAINPQFDARLNLFIANVSAVIAPIGLTYSLLSRRVLDIGFVVSRAIVVAIISLAVVAAFVLLEWALGSVLAGASHASGLVANAALALVLGLSMRYIHRRVDSMVDAIMFRKRHEDERALRAFAKEASFVTETGALFDLAIANARSHTNATGAALLMNGKGAYRNIRGFGAVPTSARENDPAILALKAWHQPLDPHRYETALTGDLALPVVARGQLHGVLLFEQRASGEAYAPDEIDALAEFARGVGAAYDALAARAEESNTTAAAIDALRATIERSLGLPKES